MKHLHHPTRKPTCAFFLFGGLLAALSSASTASPAAPERQAHNFHMQSTIVTQQHPEFRSLYQGDKSLAASADTETSMTWTAFVGYRLWGGGELYLNPELSGGAGFNGGPTNSTQGVADFPNGEIYRVDEPSPKWSLARLYYRHVISLGEEVEPVKDDKNQLAGQEAVHRVSVILGRFSLNDFFDVNSYAHDPRTQFLNWGLMDNAAWDYAADTRGYTWGIYLEYNRADWTVRWATVMVPRRANQMEMDLNFPQRRGDNLEFEYRYKLASRPGAWRVMAYRNSANMGNYRATVYDPVYQMKVENSASPSAKVGVGINLEQELSDDLGVFGRASWNDGQNETWAFTEVDRAASAGVSLRGTSWKRSDDSLALAVLVAGLSPEHRDYLAAGGYGFIIGDSRLNYGLESVLESYYRCRVAPGLDLTGDYQFVNNPAYNMDRGPVSIFSLRVHYEN